MQNERGPGADQDGNEASGENTRPQRGGEAKTTRFGVEEGDNGDIPVTGPANRDEEEEPGSS